MPELPEVEIMRQNLETWGKGSRLRRFIPEDSKWMHLVVEPGPIRGAYRRGKALIWHVGDHALIFHFRMTGKIVQMQADRKHVRARFELSNGSILGYLDQRRFAELLIMPFQAINSYFKQKGWGPEPWPISLPATWWRDRFGALNMSIKPALMRADRVVGIGNILASEICHRAGILPDKKCRDLSEQEWASLAETVVPLINRVIETESGPEISYVNQGGGNNHFDAYGRVGLKCKKCIAGVIVQIRQSGRSSYFCPNCQR